MNDGVSISSDVIGRADQAYKPIVEYSVWSQLDIDAQKWDAHLGMVRELGSADSSKLTRARDVAKRAAAIDTGAIEGLYQLDRGITITIAAQTAMWQAIFEKEKEKVRSLIECQLDAYDYVLDLATKSVPLAEVYIRELHKKICSAQGTFKALTSGGFQDQQLNHGEYKKLPNHVLKEGGTLHAYAPVQQAPMEMSRLCEIMRSREFETSHPVLQAAYAHHSFTCIHPFQDGNGRVARAVASIFLYRAASIPFLVLFDHRNSYVAALEAADVGNCQPFVDFMFSRSIEAFGLVAETLRTASAHDPVSSSMAIGNLYLTKGGYRHNEVDVAGQSLLKAIQVNLQKQINEIPHADELRFNLSGMGGDIAMPPTPPGYRHLVSMPKQSVIFEAQSLAPAAVTVRRTLVIFVPRDCGRDDEIIITCMETGDLLRDPISSVLSTNKTVTDLKVAIFSERIMGEILEQLRSQAESELKRQGY